MQSDDDWHVAERRHGLQQPLQIQRAQPEGAYQQPVRLLAATAQHLCQVRAILATASCMHIMHCLPSVNRHMVTQCAPWHICLTAVAAQPPDQKCAEEPGTECWVAVQLSTYSRVEKEQQTRHACCNREAGNRPA